MFRLNSLALRSFTAGASILPAGLEAAQEPARSDDSFFADSLDVQAINVQVVVTGPNGCRACPPRTSGSWWTASRRLSISSWRCATAAP